MKKSLMSFLIGLLILPASALILGRLGLTPVHATGETFAMGNCNRSVVIESIACAPSIRD